MVGIVPVTTAGVVAGTGATSISLRRGGLFSPRAELPRTLSGGSADDLATLTIPFRNR